MRYLIDRHMNRDYLLLQSVGYYLLVFLLARAKENISDSVPTVFKIPGIGSFALPDTNSSVVSIFMGVCFFAAIYLAISAFSTRIQEWTNTHAIAGSLSKLFSVGFWVLFIGAWLEGFSLLPPGQGLFGTALFWTGFILFLALVGNSFMTIFAGDSNSD